MSLRALGCDVVVVVIVVVIVAVVVVSQARQLRHVCPGPPISGFVFGPIFISLQMFAQKRIASKTGLVHVRR